MKYAHTNKHTYIHAYPIDIFSLSTTWAGLSLRASLRSLEILYVGNRILLAGSVSSVVRVFPLGVPSVNRLPSEASVASMGHTPDRDCAISRSPPRQRLCISPLLDANACSEHLRQALAANNCSKPLSLQQTVSTGESVCVDLCPACEKAVTEVTQCRPPSAVNPPKQSAAARSESTRLSGACCQELPPGGVRNSFRAF